MIQQIDKELAYISALMKSASLKDKKEYLIEINKLLDKRLELMK